MAWMLRGAPAGEILAGQFSSDQLRRDGDQLLLQPSRPVGDQAALVGRVRSQHSAIRFQQCPPVKFHEFGAGRVTDHVRSDGAVRVVVRVVHPIGAYPALVFPYPRNLWLIPDQGGRRPVLKRATPLGTASDVDGVLWHPPPFGALPLHTLRAHGFTTVTW